MAFPVAESQIPTTRGEVSILMKKKVDGTYEGRVFVQVLDQNENVMANIEVTGADLKPAQVQAGKDLIDSIAIDADGVIPA